MKLIHDLPKAQVFLYEEGLILTQIKDNVELEVEDVYLLKPVHAEIAGDHPYAVLVDAGHSTSLGKEGREVSAKVEYAKHCAAKAYIAKSLPQKLIANFYLRFNQPSIETRLFMEREEAIDWLRLKLKAYREALKTKAKEAGKEFK